jgi:hypothetical protein
MPTLAERCQEIWNRVKASPTEQPSRITIPAGHVESSAAPSADFQPNEHYFQVRVNELYLTNSRQWFSTYDPMVFVVSEFTYDKRVEVVPFVVGPAMMEQYGTKIPEGMIFSNTRVAGLHPYRGGRLSLSVVLCRVRRTDYPRRLLGVIESAADALDFSTALSSYVKVAGAVVDGVEALLGLGDTDPLIGLRNEFDPDAGDALRPTFFALFNAPNVDPNSLWVRDNKLYKGASLAASQPYRDTDFVLYSVVQTPERSDETTLPFYPLWERVLQLSTQPDENSWKRAKADMVSLRQTMVLSPDLTPAQADALFDRYMKRMKSEYDKASELAMLGSDRRATRLTEEDIKLRHAADILDL